MSWSLLRVRAEELRREQFQSDFHAIREANGEKPSDPITCQCCGYVGLRNVKIIDGHILGPCCAKHYDRFPCRNAEAS